MWEKAVGRVVNWDPQPYFRLLFGALHHPDQATWVEKQNAKVVSLFLEFVDELYLPIYRQQEAPKKLKGRLTDALVQFLRCLASFSGHR